jgi:carboxypeptidase C (cathepsin A)
LGAAADAAPVETHQKITANGQSFAYTTRAGFLPLLNATTGAPEAYLFFTSYSRDGVSDASTRPIIFFFGGAPGVSAAWQEFGGLGPKRMKSEGAWADNPETILNQADLVFVNPVGTGFSLPAHPNHASTFWNTSGDIASLAEFVRSYLNRSSRGTSPLFLAGEDAATGRVAGLASYLIEHMVPVRGVVLLSMMASSDATAGDTQYITLLPSLVLSSWYHKKLSPEMNLESAEQISGQSRQFASREYLHALYKGDRMSSEERAKVVADLSRLTGLSKSFVINNNLRVTFDRYNAELMRDQHRGLSRSDARVTGFQPAPSGFGFGGGGGGRGFGAQNPVDFYMSEISGPFAVAYDAYLRRELTFSGDKDAVFYLSSGGVGTFNSTGNDDANLSAAFVRNPNMHLFVSINYFDLGAPFYATEYTVAHLNVAPEVRSRNITISHQEAGQMPYMDNKAVVKLQHDLAGFVTRAAATK